MSQFEINSLVKDTEKVRFIDVENNPDNLHIDQVFVNWSVELIRSTGKVNVSIFVKSCYAYGVDENNEPLNLTFKVEQIETSTTGCNVSDDIFVKLVEIDVEKNTVIINF